jgi:hypothetical protein
MKLRSDRTIRSAASPAEIARCADDLAAAADEVFDSLVGLGEPLAQAWNEAGGGIDQQRIASLAPHIFEHLDRQPTFESAGYVFAEPALAERRRHLEWWNRLGPGSYAPLLLELDPNANDAYDYYAMEWFLAALTDHRRFVSGPLIDLPCADVCIMTFSSPVVVSGDLIGIAGADVSLARLESRLLPPLRRIGEPAVLMNRDRRVISSNDPRWTTGEKLRPLVIGPDQPWRASVPVTDDLGWTLAVSHPG